MHLEIQVIALFIFRFQLIWVESDMTRGSFKSFTNNLKPICEFCQLFVKADVKENNMGLSSSGRKTERKADGGLALSFVVFQHMMMSQVKLTRRTIQ